MKSLFRKVITITLLLCTVVVAWAAGAVTFKTEAPMFVSQGETFRVAFNLNAKPDDKNSFVAPSFENFNVLAGPTVSQGSSVQWVNGQKSSSVSYRITYLLEATKSGVFTIGAASIVADGKRCSTKPTAIEVRGEGQSASSSSSSSSATKKESAKKRADSRIEQGDLLLRLDLSSRSVYKGEPIRARLKLYSRVDIAGIESSKVPTFNGFWTQQIEVPAGPYRETLNGKVYQSYNIAEYLLYPQQDGTLTIGSAEMTVLAQVMVATEDSFDPFFGVSHQAYTIRRVLKSPVVNVQIKPFPAGAPASFTGAVGQYTLSQELSASEVAANSAVTLRLTISGSGNMNFISAPKLSLPTSFELYDVKSEEKMQNKASGSSGYRRFEYPFIVRAEGDYDVEPIEFTYFDISKRQYVTLITPSWHIKVTPDKSASSSSKLSIGVGREDVQQLGNDIRFIKLGDPALRSVVAPLVLSPLYWALVAVMLLLAISGYLFIRKYIRDNSNIVLVKGKRANRVAVKRFRIAERYMREEDRRAFYKEMLRALWGYLSDRFNIPVADLTREMVREELSHRGASAEAEAVIAVIARCEEAQYSPIETLDMENIYKEGVEAISKIEKIAK